MWLECYGLLNDSRSVTDISNIMFYILGGLCVGVVKGVAFNGVSEQGFTVKLCFTGQF